MDQPISIDEVRDAVRSLPRVRVRGGGTKPALSSDATLSVAALSGIQEYHPSEFTFTALAGTPVSVIRDALSANGQYLPFDPPWTEAGATLGGTVAAGLSGSGRFRFGGVRDFLLGVRLVTGEGLLVSGGGRVVKNAAGFDIPKLMVGSLGRLGVLVESTFKVFPAPAATMTVRADFKGTTEALTGMTRLAMSKLELSALDFEPPTRLWLRFGGQANAIPARLARVQAEIGEAARIEGHPDDRSVWRDVGEFSWAPAGHSIVRMPLIPRQIPELEKMLPASVLRRYCVGGNLAWLAWPTELDDALLKQITTQLGRPAMTLTGRNVAALEIPAWRNPLFRRLQSVFDPTGKLSPENELTTAAI